MAVRRLPLVKVRSESSVKAPPVVMNGMREVVRADTVSEVEDAIPTTSNCAVGEVRPTPTRPCESITKAVEVAVAVEVETVKSARLESAEVEVANTESLAFGELEPIA